MESLQVAFVFVVLFLMFKILSWIKQTHKKLIRSSSDPMFCVKLVSGPLQLMCIYYFLVKQQDWMSPFFKKYQVIIIIIMNNNNNNYYYYYLVYYDSCLHLLCCKPPDHQEVFFNYSYSKFVFNFQFEKSLIKYVFC